MKKIGLNGYVYDFSVDYDAIAVDDILDIHNNKTKIVNVNGYDLCFFLLVLNQVNALIFAGISIIHTQNCVFLML